MIIITILIVLISRCVLCGRTFNHYDNLQVHLTGHLGVKVHINRCNPCQKNFKNKNELDLHARSHKFAKMLGKYRINKNKKTNMALKKKIISTVGSSDKKIVRKYVKKRETAVLTRVVEKVVVRKQLQNSSSLTCAICEKGFGVRSIFVRHVKKFHPDLATTMLQSLPQVNVKKCKLPALTMPKSVPASPGLTNGHASSKPKRTPVSPKKFQDSFEKYENPTVAVPNRFPSPAYERSYSSPAAPIKAKGKAGAQKIPKTPKTPKTADYYSTLECPDCSKVFVAKSIFERHLQSAKHGHFAASASPASSLASEGYPQWPSGYGSPLAGYKSPLGGYSSPSPSPSSPSTPGSSKIECHLCGQTFVRVKDLAKHREKVCSAYHNMKKQSSS